MMAEWIITSLEECTDILGDGLHGTPKYTEKGEYAFVNGNNLVDGEILIKKETRRVDYSQYEKYKKPLTDRTILVSINGTLGNVGVYDLEKIILGKSACYFNVKQSVDKDFIYYVVSSPVFRQYLENNATGTTIKNISLKQMREYTFSIPQIDEQKKISSVLRKIDEKIKNNRAINNNLLEQALTLYATQFSLLELNGCIGDYCSVKSGFAFKSSWWTNCGIRVIKIGSINQDNLNLLECSYVDEDKADRAKDFVVKAGDLLIAMTGATIGKFAMVPYSSEVLLVNQRVGKFFLGNNPVEKLPFIYCTLKQPKVYGEVVNRGQGSAQPNISASDIMSIPCVIPSQDAINYFNDMSQPLFDLIISNQRENQQLSELRNALLPKLMSGELDVSGIDL